LISLAIIGPNRFHGEAGIRPAGSVSASRNLHYEKWCAAATRLCVGHRMAHSGAAFMEQVLNVPQRQREPDLHHHRKADDLRRRLEIAKRIASHPQIVGLPAYRPVSSDNALMHDNCARFRSDRTGSLPVRPRSRPVPNVVVRVAKIDLRLFIDYFDAVM